MRVQIPPPRMPPPRADASSLLALLHHPSTRRRSYPFLLVDRVLEWEAGVYAVGYKCVTANDNFFPGHFPQRAIMPGVLQVRCSGRLGGWRQVFFFLFICFIHSSIRARALNPALRPRLTPLCPHPSPRRSRRSRSSAASR